MDSGTSDTQILTRRFHRNVDLEISSDVEEVLHGISRRGSRYDDLIFVVPPISSLHFLPEIRTFVNEIDCFAVFVATRSSCTTSSSPNPSGDPLREVRHFVSRV